MSDFKSRLLEERDQLNEKLTKLKAFTESEAFESIPQIQKSLLLVQAQAMGAYSVALSERINNLA